MKQVSYNYNEQVINNNFNEFERRQDMFDIFFIISLIFVVIGFGVVFSLIISPKLKKRQ